MVSFQKYCEPYLKDGMIIPRLGEEPDGNALLYTATYYIITDILHEATPQHRLDLYKLVVDSWMELGRLSRGPHKKSDPASHDDHSGIAATSLFYDTAHAIMIYNEWPWWKFWPLGILPHLKLCAGKKLGVLDKLCWVANIYGTTFSKYDSTSGRILDWIKISAYERSYERSKIMQWAINKWRADIAKRYPHRMGDVFSVYFDRSLELKEENMQHPFAVYMNGRL